jgi:hypothetical protein
VTRNEGFFWRRSLESAHVWRGPKDLSDVYVESSKPTGSDDSDLNELRPTIDVESLKIKKRKKKLSCDWLTRKWGWWSPDAKDSILLGVTMILKWVSVSSLCCQLFFPNVCIIHTLSFYQSLWESRPESWFSFSSGLWLQQRPTGSLFSSEDHDSLRNKVYDLQSTVDLVTRWIVFSRSSVSPGIKQPWRVTKDRGPFDLSTITLINLIRGKL